MQRLKESQEALTLIYDAYNDVATNPLAPLDIDDQEGLKKLLDTVMNRESVSHIQNKKALKESTELRSSIADVLLLLDGCDIKEIKAAMRKATATATEEITEVEK
ncbi:hypothetical protein [Colwellia psychrerythraea]|uniref:Uncharacterized protein n=1 Tax=Colwellia psychrerythraea TaxID=28229 RepID=A0A099KKR0_COLPS|nr:hypothetical protein [Colwellia psychrerythraea]KGJ90143.1 hypothetical protein ND2E_3699 [Colwellia psychrerythraea]